MKMSKSIGNVADPFLVMEKYETDVVRYYLARVGGRFQYDNGSLHMSMFQYPIFCLTYEETTDWSEEQLVKHHQEIFSLVGNQLTRAFSPKVVARLPLAERYISIKSEIFEDIDAQLSLSMESIINETTPKDSQALTEVPGAGTHAALKELAPKFEIFMARLEIAEALEEVVKCLRLVRL